MEVVGLCCQYWVLTMCQVYSEHFTNDVLLLQGTNVVSKLISLAVGWGNDSPKRLRAWPKGSQLESGLQWCLESPDKRPFLRGEARSRKSWIPVMLQSVSLQTLHSSSPCPLKLIRCSCNLVRSDLSHPHSLGELRHNVWKLPYKVWEPTRQNAKILENIKFKNSLWQCRNQGRILGGGGGIKQPCF